MKPSGSSSRAGEPRAPHANLTIYREFREVEAAWRVLETSAPIYVFQTYDWLLLWHRTIGTAIGVEPFIVVVADNADRIVALLPLGIRYRAGCRILEFLGSIVTDYSAPLLQPEALGRTAEQLLDEIVALARPDVVLLQQMPERLRDESPNPLAMHSRALHTANSYIACLPPRFSDFAHRRNGKYFSELRRKRRKLARQGELIFETPEDPDQIMLALNVLLGLKQQKYGPDYVSRRAKPAFQEFYRRLALERLRAARPATASLRVGDVIVATSLGIVHEHRYYGLITGHEGGDWAQMSPGRVLLLDLAEWCIREGCRELDLTIGDEQYKQAWSDRRLKIYDLCCHRTPMGAAFLAAKRLTAGWRQWRESRRRAGRPHPVAAYDSRRAELSP